MNELVTLILAAGHGKRMKSKKHKVLHTVCGTPMLEHVIDLAQQLNSKETVCIIGHEREQLMPLLDQKHVKQVVQAEQLGTGHAVKMAASYFGSGDVLVLYGDTPLIDIETLNAFVAYHSANHFAASLISTVLPNPTGYGRIVRNNAGDFYRIVEQKEANASELLITEINSGICLFKASALSEGLEALRNENAQGEYYLTDVFEYLSGKGMAIGAYVSDQPDSLMGVNDRMQLAQAEGYLQRVIIKKHQMNGVTIINPEATTIGKSVTIGMDTTIYPGTILKGKTTIGEDCIIGPDADIADTKIGDGVSVKHSTLIESSVGDASNIGPYAYLRPKSVVGKAVKIGDFVEVKNSTIGDDTKISHLTYVGDSVVGKRVNIGCGVVFVNYDGSKKHISTVGDDSFIGCNSNLISPVTIGDGAYIAAGSTITKDVPPKNLAIARARQENKANWSSKYQK
ncbi:bifunctional UDP-N-acetylglucosamine diphosphorylase/glucosamine-1-phosphate N-acetyltransferase GlmU [Fusibacter paucivorans]|uniref:Bifunctional protein GlmU n=1 Tax=Fusibacter paucivorans TaxID=76009 RepID=A0ABS5PQR7_9FIRM|nr:bifunctional UDP-N-acetylglucosamine diphosphorylase/glucosamine-1-phosphate N-acetyltransferase GlmU [Fusibacter paucivorans]MBS7527257.1 bifunctional UDP-N-acetylglucosamine diphosphorylase/glucosamine-1-phosphate N-acetyltransferase GlmU [Fusibacter paucivorans]